MLPASAPVTPEASNRDTQTICPPTARPVHRRVVIGLLIFMVLALGAWVRCRNADLVFFAPGRVFFTGDSDPYLHMRMALYTYANFPAELPIDPFSGFPDGQKIGWPPGMALAIALLTMGVDLFMPSGWHLNHVAAVVPVGAGLLSIALVMLLARRLRLGWAGTLSAGLLYATAPYTAYAGILGAVDHHALEPVLLLVPALPLLRSLEEPGRRGLLLAAGSGLVAMCGFWFWQGQHLQIGLLLIAPLATWLAGRATTARSAPGGMRPLTRAAAFTLGLAAGQPLLPEGALTLTVGAGHDLGATVLHMPALWLAPALLLAVATVLVCIARPATLPTRLLWFCVAALLAGGLAVGSGMTGDFGVLWRVVFNKESALLRHVGEYLPLLRIAGDLPTCLRLSFGHGLVIAAGLATLLAWRRWPVPFAAWVLVTAVLSLQQVRLVFYSTPFLALAAGYGFAALWQRCSRGIWRASVVLALTALVGFDLPLITGFTPMTRAVYQTADWLAAATPPTGSLIDTRVRPAYGVMAPPFIGNFIVYVGRRPTIANAQNSGYTRYAAYALAHDEKSAQDALASAGARFVIDTPDAVLQERLIAAICRQAVPPGGGFARRLRTQLPQLSAHLRPIFVSVAADDDEDETGRTAPASASVHAHGNAPTLGSASATAAPWARRSIVVYERVNGATVVIPCISSGPVTLRWALPLRTHTIHVERTLVASNGLAIGVIPAPIETAIASPTLASRPIDLVVTTDDVHRGTTVTVR